MVPGKRYLWDGPLVFLGEGGLGRITIFSFFFSFFSLGDKSHFLFLGADGGEMEMGEDDCVVSLRSQNQRPGTFYDVSNFSRLPKT